jgi:signal transduction histidine kinase
MWVSRTALNEAMHELRRPLQALALATPEAEPERIERSVWMASAALARLEREINGGPAGGAHAPTAVRPLLVAVQAQWERRAAESGATLELRWRAGEAVVDGSRAELCQAVDNLVVNAIEHGGARIAIEASRQDAMLRVAVVDFGGARRGRRRRRVMPLLGGRRRRGHGLRVVRRIAAAHNGRFQLRYGSTRTEAVLELPMLAEGPVA